MPVLERPSLLAVFIFPSGFTIAFVTCATPSRGGGPAGGFSACCFQATEFVRKTAGCFLIQLGNVHDSLSGQFLAA